jgi:transcriptional regulator ATRX
MWNRDCCVGEGKGAILAHCMGLGKTFQTIAMLQCAWQYGLEQQSRRDKFLVLAPVNVIRNWEDEFDKWMPDSDSGLAPPLFTMLEAGALHADRADYLDEWNENGGIMLMGYEQFRNLSTGKGLRKGKKHEDIARRYRASLLDPGPYLVVCDEGHVLRREQSGVTRAVRQLKTKRRIVLSGTPLQNNLMEYHCMVTFVRPEMERQENGKEGVLGDTNKFKKEFVNPILNGQCVDSTDQDVKLMRYRSHVLNNTLKTCVDRADFKVLQPYLRQKHEFIIGMRMSELQVAMYRRVLEENKLQFTRDGKGIGKYVGLSVLRTYHQLAKIWTHPKVSIMHKTKKYDSMDEFIASDTESDEDDGRQKKKRKKAAKGKDGEGEGEGEDAQLASEWLEDYKARLEELVADATGKMCFLSKLLREAGAVGDKVLVGMMVEDCGSRSPSPPRVWYVYSYSSLLRGYSYSSLSYCLVFEWL